MNGFQCEKLKKLRKNSGVSQKELGKKLGISDRAVSKWENGLSKPSFENMLGLSKIFDVPLDYFLKEEKTAENINTVNGMESITELYKTGRGPSSSHTIGPEKACMIFKNQYPDADEFKVELYGSLAKTGKGHGTDEVIRKTFLPRYTTVEFKFTEENIPHPNTMELIALKDRKEIARKRVFSIGGGSIVFENEEFISPRKIYSLYRFEDVAAYCEEKGIRLWQYAVYNETEDFIDYMHNIWSIMKETVKKGLSDSGYLPGGLDVMKKAKVLYNSQHIDESKETRENRLVCAYAFAVGEQHASGERVVTAPTCGAAGILPAVLYYHQEKNNFTDEEIVHALITAGVIGNLIKTNASISGAECGCQAEVGSACAMAAAALAELFSLSIDKIEYAAEIAIEHHLGLTCDPICGLVQIPCIERNAVAAMRAINAVNLASFLWNSRKISLDRVIKTMKETGKDMHNAYKETSEGGLARIKF